MANKIFNTRVKNKRDTEANWKSKNPVLLDGEIIIVTTTSGDTRFKVGDGKKTYNQLPFQDQKTRDLIPSVDSSLSSTSTNPVQNKIIKTELDKKADNTALDGKLDKTGGTLTGNLTGKYITGTWLQTTESTDLGRAPGKIAVLDDSGWVYYRTPAEIKSDIGANAVVTTSSNGLMSASDKSKLDGIATGATKITVDTALSNTSTNPVQNKIVNSAINNLNTLVGDTAVSTQITNAVANKVDKVSGKGLSANDYTTTEKNKLAGISENAEVNQNAFSNVVVGSTTISADSKTDTLTLVAGSNVTLTPDSTNDKITITAKDTTYSASTSTPLMDGTASVGTSSAYSRGDHVHPSDTSRVNKAGDTMTGNLHMGGKDILGADEVSSGSITLTPYVTGDQAPTGVWVKLLPGNKAGTMQTITFAGGVSGDALVEVKGVSTPADDTDAANKSYVDSRWDEMQQYVNTEIRTTAPTSHASSENTYGVGTDSEYGHVKLSDSYDYVNPPGISDGIAATPTALKGVWSFAKEAADRGAGVTTTANNNISWTYRKWGNGFVECWGTFTYTNIAVTSAWGSIYESDGQTVSFPGGIFKKAPTFCSITYGGGSEAALSMEIDSEPTASKTQRFYFTRATTGTIAKAKVLAYAVGEWK